MGVSKNNMPKLGCGPQAYLSPVCSGCVLLGMFRESLFKKDKNEGSVSEVCFAQVPDPSLT